MIRKEWDALVQELTPICAEEEWTAEWQTQKEKAAEYGPVVHLPYAAGNPMAVYETLAFQATDGVTLYARYIRPAHLEKAPLVLMYHDATCPVRGWYHMTRFIALGYGVLALQNRPEGATARQTYTDALTAAHVGFDLPHTCGAVAWGEGLGGTLAMAVAALFPVEKCAVQNPLCSGPWQDCARFASLIACPVLMATCGMDAVAPPEKQAAVYRAVHGPVKHLLYPKYIHERINAYGDQLLAFLHPDAQIDC